MVAIVHSPRRSTILVALVAALGLAGAARVTRHHRHHRDREARISLANAHRRCVADHRITDAERLRDVQARIESGRVRAPDDNPPRAER